MVVPGIAIVNFIAVVLATLIVHLHLLVQSSGLSLIDDDGGRVDVVCELHDFEEDWRFLRKVVSAVEQERSNKADIYLLHFGGEGRNVLLQKLFQLAEGLCGHAVADSLVSRFVTK